MIGAGLELEGKPFWENQPQLPEELDWMYRAYWDLDPSRASNPAGPGSIPFEAADAYAKRFAVGEFERFWFCIRAMDNAYKAHFYERRAQR